MRADEWLTVGEACAIAKVCPRTVRYWIQHGKLITTRTAGGSIRILAASLFQPPAVAPAKVA